MKIFIVVDSIDVNDSSGSKANVALINNLSAIGHKITVYHYTKKYIDLPGINCVAVKEYKFGLFYFLSRLQRVIKRIVKLDFSKKLETIFGFSFTFLNDVKSIKKTLRGIHDCDMIITLSKGASFRPHYALLGLPHFYDKWLAYVHDPFPFHCYPEPYQWSEPGYKLKQKFFIKVSEKARFSAFPSLILKEWMGKFYSNFLKTGVIIPHQSFMSEYKEITFPTYFDKSKFTLLHAGNLMKQRNPEGLIRGFIQFLDKNPEAKKNSLLILLGPASYHKDVLDQYQEVFPELYVNTSNISFEEVYLLQMNVSVNIILEAKAEISPFLPGKFPHCVTANRPILHLGPKNSETMRLLGEKYKYHSTADDIDTIDSSIEGLYRLWSKESQELKLNRTDLEKYVSNIYLEEVFSEI